MAGQPSDTVLIIDDDAGKRHSIAKILRKAGFAIREAQSGADGLRLAASKPALIILDVKLPDISGFEVCRRIKEDPATAAIPVLHISTTFVDIEDRVHGLEGGADGYLTDVLEPLELVATVRALLRARRAEEAVQISTRQWQVTFDAISDGVVLLDRDGRTVQINTAMEDILGQPWDELSGRSIQELMPVSAAADDSPFTRMLASGQREAVELTVGERYLRVTVDPIRDAVGTIKGGLCIASDITDRRRLEEALRRRAEELAAAHRRKDEFLAMLAHELRNPLAPIANALESLRLVRDDPEAMEESLDIARRQIQHMARLLDDLLDVSRFTRGNVRLRKTTVDLNTILDQAVETARPLIDAGGHELSVSYPDTPVWLSGDPTRLAQVVTNLLNNAAKYTERGGRIVLKSGREGDMAVVQVRDNGMGLSAAMLPRVFDLFAQEDRSLDRSQGGLGIGLTLVHSLVQHHGGSVTADSAGPGQGSEFVVRLPLLPVAAAPPPDSPAAAPATSPLGPRRVLVVDDSRDAARSLSRVLGLWGHEVRVAHDGTEAIEAALAETFDVILLDIGLPGMDGFQVAARLRDQLGPHGPALVALTGYGQEADLARSRSAGFSEHLVKPVDLDQLRQLFTAPGTLADRGNRADMGPQSPAQAHATS
jgi:PAS domain S-box-containing protein